ncbi:MAG: gfo/Idh/MocA family oxidoreductase, partial [Silicimonas sp.]|nr:gfo/Idh/MocA family oxidoreductase [Silicimonas sp.]
MRLLILGTGAMAATHAEAFAAIEGVEVAGCVDVDRARA